MQTETIAPIFLACYKKFALHIQSFLSISSRSSLPQPCITEFEAVQSFYMKCLISSICVKPMQSSDIHYITYRVLIMPNTMQMLCK